jgi:hypothetical protein
MFYIYVHNVLYLCTCVYRMQWLVCRLLLVVSTVLAAKVRASGYSDYDVFFFKLIGVHGYIVVKSYSKTLL